MMHVLCACVKHAERIVKGFINFLLDGLAFFRELKKKKKVDEPSEVVNEEKPEELV